ncbi:hypothetical protein C8R42DRAFT_676462 [Lentinula raphanica]|nr:hypothetical protein C8R42DRAFT_676462 [Lentinula raphanica]
MPLPFFMRFPFFCLVVGLAAVCAVLSPVDSNTAHPSLQVLSSRGRSPPEKFTVSFEKRKESTTEHTERAERIMFILVLRSIKEFDLRGTQDLRFQGFPGDWTRYEKTSELEAREISGKLHGLRRCRNGCTFIATEINSAPGYWNIDIYKQSDSRVVFGRYGVKVNYEVLLHDKATSRGRNPSQHISSPPSLPLLVAFESTKESDQEHTERAEVIMNVLLHRVPQLRLSASRRIFFQNYPGDWTFQGLGNRYPKSISGMLKGAGYCGEGCTFTATEIKGWEGYWNLDIRTPEGRIIGLDSIMVKEEVDIYQREKITRERNEAKRTQDREDAAAKGLYY